MTRDSEDNKPLQKTYDAAWRGNVDLGRPPAPRCNACATSTSARKRPAPISGSQALLLPLPHRHRRCFTQSLSQDSDVRRVLTTTDVRNAPPGGSGSPSVTRSGAQHPQAMCLSGESKGGAVARGQGRLVP